MYPTDFSIVGIPEGILGMSSSGTGRYEGEE